MKFLPRYWDMTVGHRLPISLALALRRGLATNPER